MATGRDEYDYLFKGLNLTVILLHRAKDSKIHNLSATFFNSVNHLQKKHVGYFDKTDCCKKVIDMKLRVLIHSGWN